jgi:hypothetical protein
MLAQILWYGYVAKSVPEVLPDIVVNFRRSVKYGRVPLVGAGSVSGV